MFAISEIAIRVLLGCIALGMLAWLAGTRYIPHNRVGIVEKLWSLRGSLQEGHLIALAGEAGYQASILRGGLHFFLFPWQYRVHTEPLVAISEGKIGYLYARDGACLTPMQTLASYRGSLDCQDASAFLRGGGQRGRQRVILREGVYAVNTALFVVVAEDRVYAGPVRERASDLYDQWRRELAVVGGFDPVLVGGSGSRAVDAVGIVTVHDGPPIESGEIIAPEVRTKAGQRDHQYFQDPEAWLAAGGRRGKQLQVLTDGTFFINRWFATVELVEKTVIPIGYVGVVVSYHGERREDVTGEQFRYGEQVETGGRGVWKRPLPPGKYPLNPYAVRVEIVPTVNFVLRWITGVVEEHQYDKDLKSIALITADGYEPFLPLSLVLHIDYEKAPRVVQRFGDVRRLISQTLDPIISAYFRDVAQGTHMLELLTQREQIQQRATSELGRRFAEYDINCIAVLIGRPESAVSKGPDPIESLYDQLRQRRLANEQVETFGRQEEAALKERALREAIAAASKQTELTQTRLDVEIAANRGEAELAQAQRLAERDVARAGGEARSQELVGRGMASRIAQTGLAEADVFSKKIAAYGDPRLFALNLVAEQLARSTQPLVPEKVVWMAQNDQQGILGANPLGRLLGLLFAEKAGAVLGENPAARAERDEALVVPEKTAAATPVELDPSLPNNA